MFPDGILYDKKSGKIEPLSVNSIFTYSALLSGSCGEKEKGLCGKKTTKSPLVLRAGLEPARSR